jgi:D-sedoheptulose 7-phosphate isomerase
MSGAPASVQAIADRLRQTAAAHERLASGELAALSHAAEAMQAALAAGRTILVFGNGGSAADAQHFAAELVGRYEHDRPGRAALALTTDGSVLTAAANDYGFQRVFARQIDALGRAGDVALAITTSGRSPNVVCGLEAANRRGLVTIALTARDGGDAGRLARIHVNVPEARTPIAQEVHRTVLHVWCELLDRDQTTRD